MDRYKGVDEITFYSFPVRLWQTSKHPGSSTDDILLVGFVREADNWYSGFPEEFKDNLKWLALHFQPLH